MTDVERKLELTRSAGRGQNKPDEDKNAGEYSLRDGKVL